MRIEYARHSAFLLFWRKKIVYVVSYRSSSHVGYANIEQKYKERRWVGNATNAILCPNAGFSFIKLQVNLADAIFWSLFAIGKVRFWLGPQSLLMWGISFSFDSTQIKFKLECINYTVMNWLSLYRMNMLWSNMYSPATEGRENLRGCPFPVHIIQYTLRRCELLWDSHIRCVCIAYVKQYQYETQY